MLVEDRIFMLVEIMLKKCENKSVDNSVSLNQYHNDMGTVDYVYEFRLETGEDDGFMSTQIDYQMTFCFGDGPSLPFINISYSDTWNDNVKVFDEERINKLRTRIESIYKDSRDDQFDKILSKTMDYFDIEESEIRDVKIKKLLENE